MVQSKNKLRRKLLDIITLVTVCFLVATLKVSAQQHLENNMSQYFLNRSLWNPAFTGEEGGKIQILHNRSWLGFSGAPVQTVFSGDMAFGKSSALGLQLITDVSGILHRNYALLNYSYKIPFNASEHLRIGVSLSANSDRLDKTQLDPSAASDPLLLDNINQKVKYDGNIGIAYNNNRVSLGASFLRLSDNLSKLQPNGKASNLPWFRFGTVISIPTDVTEKLLFKPIAMLQLFKTSNPVFDIGSQFYYNKSFNVMLLYQTLGNIRTGAGIYIKNFGEADIYYNTMVKSSSYQAQQFELSFSYQFKHVKKSKEQE